jgi:hypothetical protein
MSTFRRSALTASLMAVVSMASPPAAHACGYHNDVTMARGLLNWVYPDALYVVGAMSRAVAEGRLPATSSTRAAPDLFGGRYRRTVRSLEELGRRLRTASGGEPIPPLSLVLVEPMLWTRFAPEAGDLRTVLHVAAPQAGELVLVSGEAVIGEIARGRLSIAKAHEEGFLRVYGTLEQTSQFLLRYGAVGTGPELTHAHGARWEGRLEAAAMTPMEPGGDHMNSIATWPASSRTGVMGLCGPVAQ